MSVWRSPVLYTGIFLVLLVAGLISAPFLIDWNSYRGTVEDYAHKLTGRDVTVTGDISVRLFPWPHLRLKGVRVANVPGTLISDVARAETVEARMLLGSLLGGRVEVSNIRIVKPVFSFERLDTSDVNWWLSPKLEGGGSLRAEKISIEDLEIVDGTLFVSDTRRGGTAEFNDVDMSVSAQSLLGPWKARGQLAHKGRPFSVGISTATYKKGEPFRFNFRFSPVEGSGLVYLFDGAYSSQGDEPLSGTITAEPYVADSGKADSQSNMRPLLFKADIGFREDHALLRNIEIAPADREHAGNILTGSAAIDLQERISVMADLRSPNYDLDAMLGNRGREVLKSGAFLEGVADFLEVLPGTLDGRVRLDIGNLIAGGAKLQGTRLEAELSESGLIIHDLAVTMPGQTKSRLIGKFTVGGEQPTLTGNLTVESANAREFASWAMPEWKEAIARSWTGARGKLALEATFEHQPRSLKLGEAKLSFDDAHATGALSMLGGEAGQTTLRLAVDRIDADRYVAADAKIADLRDDASGLITELFRPGSERNNVQLTVLAGELKLRGTEARDIAVDVAASNDAINVHAINIGSVGDARLAVTGSLQPRQAQRHGTATIEIDAPDPEPLLRLLGVLGMPGETNGRATAWAKNLGPFHARLDGEADLDNDSIAATIGGKITAGGSNLVANGSLESDPDDFQSADVMFSAELDSPDTRSLALLFGIEGQTDVQDGAHLTLRSKGTLRDGLKSQAQLTALGATASFDGTLTKLAPALATTGAVSIEAAAADRVLAALGIPNPEPGAPISVKGSITTGDDMLTLDGFTATVGTKRYAGRLRTGRGTIDVQMKAADVSLPWMLSATLLPRDGRPVDSVTLFAPKPLGGAIGVVSVEAERLNIAPHLAIRDARVAFDATAEKLHITLSGLGSDTGLVTADADIVRRAGDYDVSATFSAGLDLGEQLVTSAGQPVVIGPAHFSGSFSGMGRSPAGLASVLKGSGQIKLDYGLLAGVDHARLAAGLAAVRSEGEVDAVVGQALSGGELGFSGGAAALRISDGLASLGPVAIQAGQLSGQMAALIELASGRAELKVDLGLPAVGEAPAISLAYAGPRDGLERNLDAAAFKSRLRAKSLREEMARLEALQREEEQIVAEEMRRTEKDKRARQREDDLNGLWGVILNDLNKLEMERRSRELAAWKRGQEPATGQVTIDVAPLPALPVESVKASEPEPEPVSIEMSPLPEGLGNAEAVAPAAAPKTPAVERTPAPKPAPAMPDETLLPAAPTVLKLAPAAVNGRAASSLSDVEPEVQGGIRYRGNFNRGSVPLAPTTGRSE